MTTGRSRFRRRMWTGASCAGRPIAACTTVRSGQKLLDRLGPDPLADEPGGHDDPQRAYDAILKSKKPIAELLMDQAIICGHWEYLPGGAVVSAPSESIYAGQRDGA